MRKIYADLCVYKEFIESAVFIKLKDEGFQEAVKRIDAQKLTRVRFRRVISMHLCFKMRYPCMDAIFWNMITTTATTTI